MKTETVTLTTMTASEFNNLVNEHFPQAKNSYDVVEEQELHNYTTLAYAPAVYDSDIAYGESFMYAFTDIVYMLQKRGVIPIGNVQVDCSW